MILLYARFRRSAEILACADDFEPVLQVRLFAEERDELLADELTFGPVIEYRLDRKPLFRSIEDIRAFNRRKSLLMLVCRSKSMIWH